MSDPTTFQVRSFLDEFDAWYVDYEGARAHVLRNYSDANAATAMAIAESVANTVHPIAEDAWEGEPF